MKRRDFLRALPIGAMATGIPFSLGKVRAEGLMNSPLLSAMLNGNEETDKVVVIIFLEGGNDGLNTLVPFEDPLYDKYRVNTGFSTAAEKKLLTFKARPDLGFNPSMNSLQPLWDEGKIAVVQNLGTPHFELSHFNSLDLWNSASHADLIVPTGWVGRYLENAYPNYPSVLPEDPIAITMGPLESSIFQGERGMVNILTHNPNVGAPDGDLITDPVADNEGGHELEFVRGLIKVSNTYNKRFSDLFPKNAVNKVTYPDNGLAKHLQQTAWCIASGMKTRVYFTAQIGYDLHSDQFSKDPLQDGHAKLLQELSSSLLAFQRDLEALGVADRVVTLTYSEFGRRLKEYGGWSTGTDHGTAAPHLLIGTKVNGELYGKHPNLVDLDENGNPFNEFDFRQFYASVLGGWFGVAEPLRTSLLSPGRDINPFSIDFPVNGKSITQKLLQEGSTSVRGSGRETLDFMATVSPNPARDFTELRLLLSKRENVEITLFNISGVKIATLLQSSLAQGEHRVPVMMRELSSGVYYLHIRKGSNTKTVKVVKK
jgi:uncharacterized protein (DUF1501 family)